MLIAIFGSAFRAVTVFLFLPKFLSKIDFDGLVKSRKCSLSVIPAKAGIQCSQALMKPLDPVFQRGDDFLYSHQFLYICKLTLSSLLIGFHRLYMMPAF
ncbi:MAG: hypothetical protein COS92_06795 [Desulfobacterales bacterium CG07_land_8_20_14_0_80_52_14]|nr:MAG: hypothetical protein COX20_12825 [Desulfobacterales bacterium CG23_combo_of_CG06-09_8_20_14_all_52_9]PIU49427.1 MAG: hypothetical protein COS92_06795 [Desulfobacterales bacterium CG07_land_8_20_14_0_80_52_14]